MEKTALSVILFFALVLSAAAQTPANTLRDRIQEVRDGYQAAVQQIRGMDQVKMQGLRDQFKSDMNNLRVDVQKKIENERNVLKSKIQGIKDKIKQGAVSRIANSLNNLNQRLTKQFGDLLDKLDQVLSRISSRADKAQARGIDVSTVRTQIQAAETAIGAARDAVKAQAAKTYPISLPDTISSSTMSNLRNIVGGVRNTLKSDLTAVQSAIKAARSAVQQAATTLAKIPRVNENATLTATSTATSTNQ